MLTGARACACVCAALKFLANWLWAVRPAPREYWGPPFRYASRYPIAPVLSNLPAALLPYIGSIAPKGR